MTTYVKLAEKSAILQHIEIYITHTFNSSENGKLDKSIYQVNDRKYLFSKRAISNKNE